MKRSEYLEKHNEIVKEIMNKENELNELWRELRKLDNQYLINRED